MASGNKVRIYSLFVMSKTAMPLFYFIFYKKREMLFSHEVFLILISVNSLLFSLLYWGF